MSAIPAHVEALTAAWCAHWAHTRRPPRLDVVEAWAAHASPDPLQAGVVDLGAFCSAYEDPHDIAAAWATLWDWYEMLTSAGVVHGSPHRQGRLAVVPAAL